MSETIYCYCCRVHHPKEDMRRFTTRAGERWRCLRSIVAAGSSRQARDAFGERQTRQNQESSRRQLDWQVDTRKQGSF